MEAPARSPTAYAIFSYDIRPIINQEMPNLKPTELFKEIAKRWKVAPENPNRQTADQEQ